MLIIYSVTVKVVSEHTSIQRDLSLPWQLPSAYKAPWQGHTPTPQRGKVRDATEAHCLVTGSYLSVQSKIMESFSPGGGMNACQPEDCCSLNHHRARNASPPTT